MATKTAKTSGSRTALTGAAYPSLVNDSTASGLVSNAERVKEGILNLIRDRSILPGQRLDQRLLASRLDTTTAPLREAISALESEGLLTRQPGLGVFCRIYTVLEVEELVEIRGVLEALAARRATAYITDADIDELRGLAVQLGKPFPPEGARAFVQTHVQFHKRIVEMSRSPRLRSLLEFHHFIDEVLCNISPTLWKVEPHDHLGLVEALASRDSEWAERAMRNHIAPTYQNRFASLRKLFGEGPILSPR
jgi:DNA-binding GntR family transcriptional regulator